MGKDEYEVVVYVGELCVVIKLLVDSMLIRIGRDLLFQEIADLAETVFLRLPDRPVHRHRCHDALPFCVNTSEEEEKTFEREGKA